MGIRDSLNPGRWWDGHLNIQRPTSKAKVNHKDTEVQSKAGRDANYKGTRIREAGGIANLKFEGLNAETQSEQRGRPTRTGNGLGEGKLALILAWLGRQAAPQGEGTRGGGGTSFEGGGHRSRLGWRVRRQKMAAKDGLPLRGREAAKGAISDLKFEISDSNAETQWEQGLHGKRTVMQPLRG
jgi:hypothetical protein